MNTVKRVVLMVLVVALSMATAAEAKGKKHKKAGQARGAALTSTITVDGTDYQIRLIPLPDGAKPGKAGKSRQPVVVLNGTKYLVKIVDPNAPRAGKKGKHGKGDAKGRKKAGKGKKHGKKKV